MERGPDTAKTRSEAVKAQAARLGFDACGIAGAGRLDEEAARLEAWLAEGRHASMHWMERHFEKRVDPTKLVPGARSVVSVLQSYYHESGRHQNDASGKISRYAWGDDYHSVMKDRLYQLFHWIDETIEPIKGRVFVDSAPVMDKAWAQRAGLGWIGKHTNLINRNLGSYFFIGELIIDLELQPDRPVPDYCGTCTRCIDACPTDAINPAYQLDANRCISYLTIEHRSDHIPEKLRHRLENWVFGCDVCQDVCPWNKFKRTSSEARYQPRPDVVGTSLGQWEKMGKEEFERMFAGSAVQRTGFSGFKRNVRWANEPSREEAECRVDESGD